MKTSDKAATLDERRAAVSGMPDGPAQDLVWQAVHELGARERDAAQTLVIEQLEVLRTMKPERDEALKSCAAMRAAVEDIDCDLEVVATTDHEDARTACLTHCRELTQAALATDELAASFLAAARPGPAGYTSRPVAEIIAEAVAGVKL